jgi:uncharacterized protein
MKTFIITLLFAAYGLTANSQTHNIVFDLTTSDTNVHKSVMRWIGGITQDRPDAKLEVVLYGQSLDMIRSGKSVVEAPLLKFLSNPNVSFKVCAKSLSRQNISDKELLKGVEIVPDGISEIVTRQSQGWGYIKAAN